MNFKLLKNVKINTKTTSFTLLRKVGIILLFYLNEISVIYQTNLKIRKFKIELQ